ncbi:MAG: hypothetical protein LBJ10_02030 [Clostridiales bacterium]|nr:hypothetical protein [Clostridiales bacterium]
MKLNLVFAAVSGTGFGGFSVAGQSVALATGPAGLGFYTSPVPILKGQVASVTITSAAIATPPLIFYPPKLVSFTDA